MSRRFFLHTLYIQRLIFVRSLKTHTLENVRAKQNEILIDQRLEPHYNYFDLDFFILVLSFSPLLN
jgi:hypothetical protein